MWKKGDSTAYIVRAFHLSTVGRCLQHWVPFYLLDFMSDFVHIDATVICFLLIITVPTLKYMYTGWVTKPDKNHRLHVHVAKTPTKSNQ